MTDKTTIKVEGLRELTQFLEKELPESLRRTSTLAGMKQAMKPMIAAAVNRAPFRSGALRASIKAKTVRKRDENFAAIVWGPMTNVPESQARWTLKYLYERGEWAASSKRKAPAGPYYGKFHEFGYYNKLLNRHIPGKFFLRKAFDAYLPYYLSTLKKHIEKKAIAAAKRHNAKSRANGKRNSR